MSFWNDLLVRGTPIVGLSPMDGVTDAVMRYMTACYSAGVDVMFTEFVSVDALHYAEGERRERLLKTFIKARDVGPLEHRPYEIAQVFGTKPELFVEAAKLVESLGFDGIDINMGCPARKVEENGAGAGLIRTPELAVEIIQAVKGATKLPVSVKTRIGVEREEVEDWIRVLSSAEPAMISLHGRTLKQLYQGEADWEAIKRAARVAHELGGHMLGNGDIESVDAGMRRVEETGVDGFLIGRAAQGNPAFANASAGEASREQIMSWILEHAKLFDEIFVQGIEDETQRLKAFMPVRKHLAWYAHGFPGAAELRIKLVQSNSYRQVEEILAQAV